MNKFHKYTAALLAAIITACSLSSTVFAEEEIETAVTLNATVISTRPDGYVFANDRDGGLTKGMVEDTLAEDNTPVLTESGWYLYKSDTPVIDDAKKAKPAVDFSKDSDYSFDANQFYYWYHLTSPDPIADIVASANNIVNGENDQMQKLYAVAFAENAVAIASSDSAASYDYKVNYTEKKKEKEMYPATQAAYGVNNILQLLISASNGDTKLSDHTDSDTKKYYEAIKKKYEKGGKKSKILTDYIASLKTDKCHDVRLNIAVNYPLTLSAGETVTLGDKTQSYEYSFDSSSFYPVSGLGFLGDQTDMEAYFTMSLAGAFVYHGGETFSISGNDDIWVFVNGKLVFDMGGLHYPMGGDINIDSVAKKLKIKKGDNCRLDIFYANRQSMTSSLSIKTTLVLTPLAGNSANNSSDVGSLKNPNESNPFSVKNILLIAAAALAVILLLNFISRKSRSHGKSAKRNSPKKQSRRAPEKRRQSGKSNAESRKSFDDIDSLDELYGDDDGEEVRTSRKRDKSDDSDFARPDDGDDLSYLLSDIPEIDFDDDDD